MKACLLSISKSVKFECGVGHYYVAAKVGDEFRDRILGLFKMILNLFFLLKKKKIGQI